MPLSSPFMASLAPSLLHGVSSVSEDTREMLVSLRQSEHVLRHRMTLKEARLLHEVLGRSIAVFDQRNRVPACARSSRTLSIAWWLIPTIIVDIAALALIERAMS